MAFPSIGIYNWSIYKITNPNNRVYIGVSSNIQRRLKDYRRGVKQSQPLIMRSLSKYGIESHNFEIIDSFESDLNFAMGKEMFWIRSYMSNSHKFPEQKGMNLTDGGQGAKGYKMNEAQRKAMSERNKGYKHTPEALKKISEASKRYMPGRKVSEATREKLRQANLGKKYSEETCRKLSEMKKGKKIKSGWTSEKKEAMSETKLRLAYKHTDETKKKIGEFSKGNKYSLGQKHSEEWKKNMSEKMKEIRRKQKTK